MSHPIAILVTGLTMDFSKKINPQKDTTQLDKDIEASLATLDSLPDFYYRRFDIDPSSPPEAPNSFAAWKRLIRQGSPQGEPWSAQAFGLGVKMAPPLTTLFENMVNTVVESSGGKTKLLFCAAADDHWELVKRGFPDLALGDKPKVDGQ